MAIQRRFKIEHSAVFPNGAWLKGAVEPVFDFSADKREDGSRPQMSDKETGLLVWQAVVLDADEAAGKKDTAITVKFLAKVRPVPPENKTAFPWTPIEFVGLEATPWVDDSGSRPRLSWSFRAEDMIEPSQTKSSNTPSTKAAA